MRYIFVIWHVVATRSSLTNDGKKDYCDTHQWHGTCRYLLRRNSCEPPLQHRPNPEIRRVSINKTFAARTRDGKCVQPQVLEPFSSLQPRAQQGPKTWLMQTLLLNIYVHALGYLKNAAQGAPVAQNLDHATLP